MSVMNRAGNRKTTATQQILHPVILPVPESVTTFKHRDQVVFLSRHARKALKLSAEKSGIRSLELMKNKNGAPLPSAGTYWSLTHKKEYVGGVVATRPIGIDIEKIEPCSRGLFQKVASKPEWALAVQAENDVSTFYRYWTSKEAVLKACATGIKDLLTCRIYCLIDSHHLKIDYQRQLWQLEHFFFGDHIATVVQHDFQIEWSLSPAES